MAFLNQLALRGATNKDDDMTRREFIQDTAVVASLLALPNTFAAEGARKFTINLMPGMIGVSARTQQELNALAARHRFESVEPMGGDLANKSEAELTDLRKEMQTQKLVWGAAGLPVDFRGEDAVFEQGMRDFPRIAKGLQRAGAKRVGTWISPAHGALTYRQNFARYTKRLGAIARVLEDHDLRLGLEYIGTFTLRAGRKHPFIHTMAEMLELIEAVGSRSLGLTLDSWHWWQGQDTREEILKLRNDQVIAVDLNDAPLNRKKEEQLDGQRELPGATGVIPITDFLTALVEIGYDGPARAEPFNRPLNDMDNDAACAATNAAIRKTLEAAKI